VCTGTEKCWWGDKGGEALIRKRGEKEQRGGGEKNSSRFVLWPVDLMEGGGTKVFTWDEERRVDWRRVLGGMIEFRTKKKGRGEAIENPQK